MCAFEIVPSCFLSALRLLSPGGGGCAGSAVDYRNWHLGLGRRFRSLKVWFVLRSYGVAGFQAHLRKASRFLTCLTPCHTRTNYPRCVQGIALNEHFASLVRASPEFELVTKPVLALSVIRLKLPSSSAHSLSDEAKAEATNALNKALYARTERASDKLFLTQTSLNGTVCVRFAIGAQRTEREHIERAWELIRECGAEAVRELGANGANGAVVKA